MGPVAIAFGAASTASLGLAIFSRDRYAPWLALMLLACWGLWQAFQAIMPIPQAWTAFPLLDLGCFVVCAVLARPVGEKWLWLLAFALLGQLIAHGAFWINWNQLGAVPDNQAAWRLEWTYVLILNLLFAAQLACVGWPGVRHGLELVSRGGLVDLHPGGRRPS